MKENAQYAQGRIDTLAASLSAMGLPVRAIARGAGVSKETACRALHGEGIQAYNFFKLEYFIMNYYKSQEQQSLLRAAGRMQARMAFNKSQELRKGMEAAKVSRTDNK